MMNQTQFAVGQVVNVLAAIGIPKFEKVIHSGRVERITFQSSNGEPLYWVSGLRCARSACVLREVA